MLYIVSEARHPNKREVSDYDEIPENDAGDKDMLNDDNIEPQNDADPGRLSNKHISNNNNDVSTDGKNMKDIEIGWKETEEQ